MIILLQDYRYALLETRGGSRSLTNKPVNGESMSASVSHTIRQIQHVALEHVDQPAKAEAGFRIIIDSPGSVAEPET